MKLVTKITLSLGHNFLELTKPDNRKLKLKIKIFRINNLKTCTYQFLKIILKNYQIVIQKIILQVYRLINYKLYVINFRKIKSKNWHRISTRIINLKLDIKYLH